MEPMPPGPHLDSLITTKIFKLEVNPWNVRPYSIEIMAAWAIVEHFADWDFSLSRHQGLWIARFIKWGKIEQAKGEARTDALAICRAALATIGE